MTLVPYRSDDGAPDNDRFEGALCPYSDGRALHTLSSVRWVCLLESRMCGISPVWPCALAARTPSDHGKILLREMCVGFRFFHNEVHFESFFWIEVRHLSNRSCSHVQIIKRERSMNGRACGITEHVFKLKQSVMLNMCLFNDQAHRGKIRIGIDRQR